MSEKKVKFLIYLILLVITLQNVSSLGLSPAIKSYNFVPDDVIGIRYNVLSSPDIEVEVSAEGDLAKYVSFDKIGIVDSGEFIATINLPHSIETPGPHRLSIVVGQKIDPELATGFIGTRIVVVGAVDIYVPYPGRYIELQLKGYDVNVGEPVNFELGISSKGTEGVNITPKIEIYSGNEKVRDLYFNNRFLGSQESIVLQKQLETRELNPGNYKAIAFVDYGALDQAETTFRVGDLNIDITNYSNRIPITKLQPFNIEVESGWNNNIDGVFADVQILNGSIVFSSFKTTSTSLTPWEKKIITGYVDTSNFTEGAYDANLTLTYYGKDQRGTTNEMVKVQFYKGPSILIWFIIGGLGILIILILIAIKFIQKINHIKHGKIKSSRKK